MSNPGSQPGTQVAVQPQQPVALTENDLTHHKQELGWMGSILGSRENAPYYIAGIAIVASLIMLGIVITLQPQNGSAMTLLGAIITGALGYVFGKSSS